MKPVRLALLWHMHQPLYREPETGEYLMPWVRLHATRAYNDMAWILERHPGVRCTVNFVPVLLEQLDDYVSGRARDRFLDLTLRPAPDLALEERAAIIRSFFMVDWETNIQPLPRYWELLQKRGRDPMGADLDRLAHAFTDGELTDLQVLFNLAWMGFGALEDEPALQTLRRKGRDYTRDDVEVVAATQVRILAGIVPRWRALAERGQVELSATPYYHPILPLVCDTDAARRALPDLPLPPRFAHPEDARWQVREAVLSHARRFGTPPAGMWPAEGSVSPEALAVLASEGVRWAASDEGVLLRSLPEGTSRLRSLYRPWRVDAGPGGELSMLFRDRSLSDVIGFTYAKVAARHAVQDFTTHVRAVGEAWAAERQPGPATVGVFLDGENAWEHYPASGHEFLDRLYGDLETSAEIETVTMSEAVAGAARSSHPPHPLRLLDRGELPDLDRPRRGPAGLDRARRGARPARGGGAGRGGRAGAARAGPASPLRGRGLRLVLVVRRRLRHRPGGRVRQPLPRAGDPGLAAPGRQPAGRGAHPHQADGREAGAFRLEAKPLREPTLLLTPRLDGRETDLLRVAGLRPVPARTDTAGRCTAGRRAFNVLRYGFDLDLDLPPARSRPRRRSGRRRWPRSLKVELLGPGGQTWVDFELRPDGRVRAGLRRGEPLGELAFDAVAELRLPFAGLGLTPGTKVALCVHALREEVEVERLPRYGFVAFPIPDRDFDAARTGGCEGRRRAKVVYPPPHRWPRRTHGRGSPVRPSPSRASRVEDGQPTAGGLLGGGGAGAGRRRPRGAGARGGDRARPALRAAARRRRRLAAPRPDRAGRRGPPGGGHGLHQRHLRERPADHLPQAVAGRPDRGRLLRAPLPAPGRGRRRGPGGAGRPGPARRPDRPGQPARLRGVAAQREVSRARRAGAALAVVALDIDHFKRVNDTHGHAAGDVVLAEVAARAQRALRAEDLLARIGGEELAALLPGANLAAAAEVAERIRYAVSDASIPVAGAAVDVSVSLGCAALSAEEKDAAAMLARADARLYDAKRAGRNRVVWAPLAAQDPSGE